MKQSIQTVDGLLILDTVGNPSTDGFSPMVKLIPTKLPIPITLKIDKTEAQIIGMAFLRMASECQS